MSTKKQSDFNPDELIATSAAHERSLEELQASVVKLEKRVGDNAALAKSFQQAFENDKKMDAVLTALICNLIVSNDDLKESIEKAVAKVDRKWWNGTSKKTLGAIGGVALVVLGAFLQGWFTKIFGDGNG